MTHRKIVSVAAGTAALALALSGCSGGDSGTGGGGGFDPGARITMIVPMGPGGGSDVSGRAIASGLEGVTDKTISVENLQGGGGAVGYAEFMTHEGDASYLLGTETAMVNLPLTQDVPFTWQSFTPIMKVGQDSAMVVVSKDSAYTSCAEVVEAARTSTVKAAASGGPTGNDAIQLNLIQKDQGITFQQVPYESGGEAIAAAMGGHVDIAVANPSEIVGQLESGDMKALCAISDERYSYDDLKDIPTTIEEGINVTFSQFRGIIAPGGLSDEAKQYWIDASKQYAETDEFTTYMEDNYMQTAQLYGDEFADYLSNYEADLKAGLDA